MNIKTIIITGLCLIMLINPVLGNVEVNKTRDCFLTESPPSFLHIGNTINDLATNLITSKSNVLTPEIIAQGPREKTPLGAWLDSILTPSSIGNENKFNAEKYRL